MFRLPDHISVETLLEQEHPAVAANKDRWQIGLDAYDNEGGFLDGSNIWKFPREDQAQFETRKAQARYHNVAATLIDYYARKVFGDEITRETGSAELEAWWQNVDGAGTDLSSFMRFTLVKALAGAHVGILADKTADAPTGPSKADERAQVFLTRFMPTAILDWRLDREERLLSVKLAEAIDSGDLLVDADERTSDQALLWDEDEWVRVSGPDDAVQVERVTHGLGLVPLVVLRPFRSSRWSLIGKSLLGDGSILRALYNRGSEHDTVLRDQAFSVFVVGLPANGEVTVERAKEALGSEIGSSRALFVYGTGSYATPDMQVPTTLELHQSFLVRELYRMAHVPYERDSREAMSAEAIALQHEELASMLQGVASECERVETELCKLYFAWNAATPEQAVKDFENAKVRINYPSEFFKGDPKAKLETLADAMNAVPAPTFERLVQKQIVAETLPGLDAQTKADIDKEIDDGLAEKPDPMQLDPTTLRQGAAGRLRGFVAQGDDEVAA